MLIAYALVVALAVGFLSGGRPVGLATLQIRWPGLVAAGIAGQVVLFADPVAQRVGDLGPTLYVLTTLAVVGAMVRNLSIAGMPVVAAGAICNLAAVVTNGGYMPASRAALEAAGRTMPGAYSNSSYAANPSVWPLTDVFALPSWMPLANVFSVGDVLIALGIGSIIVLAMRRSGRPDVQPGLMSPAPKDA
jgi:hypothetical protein